MSMNFVIDSAQENGVITDTVATALHERLDDKTVADIQNNAFAFSRQIGQMDGAKAIDVAKSMLTFMREVELLPDPDTAPAAPSLPQNISLVVPLKRTEMRLKKLLEELKANPGDADELIRLILTQDEVVMANIKLRGSNAWAIVTGDKLDVDLTYEFVVYLADPHNPAPAGKWKSHWPTTLDRALGRNVQLMVYPLALRGEQKAFKGIDAYDNNWTTLPDRVHEALCAAVDQDKLVVKNEAERRRLSHDIFDSPDLPPYLEELVDEYEHDKSLGNGVSRYVTERQASQLDQQASGSRLPFSGSGEQPEELDPDWCLEQLEAICKRGADLMNGHIDKGPGVFRSLKTMNGNVRLDRTIVLGKIETMNGQISGIGYARGKASTMRGTVGDDVYDKQEIVALYKKAREFRLL